MSNPITLVMAYYENPGMLQLHYEHIRALPARVRDFLQVIIVDDGSPEPAKPPEADLGVPMQLYRIKVDVRWNQDAARNIGMRHSETEWCLLTDMDLLVPEETWLGLMTREHDQEKVYTFTRKCRRPKEEGGGLIDYHPHPNSWFITRRVFDSIGGYDERFAGIYGSDGDFRNRLREPRGDHPGYVLEQLSEHLIMYPRSVVADASTTRYKRKQPEDDIGKRRVRDQRKIEGGKDGTGWLPKRYLFPYEQVWCSQ